MKKCLAIIIAALMIFTLLPTAAMADESQQVLETTSSEPSDGCIFLGIEGSYYTDAQAALDRINEIRYEACTNGNVPDPRDSSRMLTESDYVPIKWSSALEKIARIRAHEAAITMEHSRLNGGYILNISYDGVKSSAEVIAWNYDKAMVTGVNQWYEEMSDWVNQTSGTTTGHYTSMINPDNTYVGLGDFYTNKTLYPKFVVGEFSKSTSSLDQTMLDGCANIIQKVDVNTSYITYSLSNEKFYEGEDTEVELKADVLYGSDLSIFGDVTFKSSDTSVATVSGNTIHGIKQGDVTITAYIDGSEAATFDITVGCKHSYSSSSTTDGVFTGICTKCGQTITFNVPTKMTLYNSKSYLSGYSTNTSRELDEGESLYIWLYTLTGGDEDCRNVIVESSDTSIISGPTVITYTTAKYPIYEYITKSHGTATLTIYSEYNPSLKRTIKVTVTGDPVTVEGKDATCTETGLTEGSYCSKCGGVITEQEVIPALGHDYQDVEGTYKAPTCTAAGKAADQKCSRCSDVKTGNVINATGHTIVTDAAVAPTCTKTGLTEGSHCSVCGEIITAQKTVAATGHTNVTDAAVDPTCTKTGLTEGSHCSVCDEVFTAQEVIPALGHDYQEVEGTYKAPTCTVAGKAADQKCSRCGDEITGNVINATGHTIVTDVVVDPTCTKTGLTKGSHCSICDEVISAQEVIPALGHDYQDIEGTYKAPTCTVAGKAADQKCSRCGDTITGKEIAATGHTPAAAVKENVETATCTKDGSYDSVVYCSECKAEISRTTEIVNATGHTPAAAVKENVEAATCTKDGSYVSVVYCSVCKAEISRTNETVKATGHTPAAAVKENIVAATYTSTGSYDSVVYCSVCKCELSREHMTTSALPKLAPTIKVKKTKATYKYAKVKKKAQTLAIGATVNSKGTLSYKVTKYYGKAKKYLKLNTKTGKITVKKGTPKGIYKIKVKITAAAKGNYKSGNLTKTITVKVK